MEHDIYNYIKYMRMIIYTPEVQDMYLSGYDLFAVFFFSLCPEDSARNILSDTI